MFLYFNRPISICFSYIPLKVFIKLIVCIFGMLQDQSSILNLENGRINRAQFAKAHSIPAEGAILRCKHFGMIFKHVGMFLSSKPIGSTIIARFIFRIA